MSQTNYGDAQNGAMETLLYSASPSSASDWSRDIDGMDLSSRIDQTKKADVIVRATLTGHKDVGYGAIVSSMKVLEVYRGASLHQGDSVTLIEPYEIKRLSSQEIRYMRKESPDSYAGLLDAYGLSDGDDIRVMQPNEEPYLSGTVPVSGSSEYLLFLEYSDSHLARDSDAAAFTYVPTPFACVPSWETEGGEIWNQRRYVTEEELKGVTFLAADGKTSSEYARIAADLRAYSEGLRR